MQLERAVIAGWKRQLWQARRVRFEQHAEHAADVSCWQACLEVQRVDGRRTVDADWVAENGQVCWLVRAACIDAEEGISGGC